MTLRRRLGWSPATACDILQLWQRQEAETQVSGFKPTACAQLACLGCIMESYCDPSLITIGLVSLRMPHCAVTNSTIEAPARWLRQVL